MSRLYHHQQWQQQQWQWWQHHHHTTKHDEEAKKRPKGRDKHLLGHRYEDHSVSFLSFILLLC